MYANEVIEILKDKTHPKRAEVAGHLVSFLSDGIFGMCFGAQVNRAPVADRADRVAKRTQVLKEMTEGADAATAHVVQFIEDDLNSFSVSFTHFLEDGGKYTFRRD
jgi:hypothetical protein